MNFKIFALISQKIRINKNIFRIQVINTTKYTFHKIFLSEFYKFLTILSFNSKPTSTKLIPKKLLKKKGFSIREKLRSTTTKIAQTTTIIALPLSL